MTDEPGVDDKRGRIGGHIVHHRLAAAKFQLLPRVRGPALHEMNTFLALNYTIASRGREIARAVRDTGATVLVGCSGSPFDLPAAFVAGLTSRVPVIAYLFDDPVYQWPPGMYRNLARRWERLWFPRVAALIAPNEVLADDVNGRHPHPRHITLIRNPVEMDAAPGGDRGKDESAHPGEPKRLVYTGSVYHAQADAFRNLVAAMDRLQGRYRLHVYTSQSEQALADQGVAGPHVTLHEHVALEEALRAQRRADVLFLPLAFRSSIQEVVRSSAPAKMGEYLASGRPILVHAPEDSFVSTFFRERGCGAVATRLEPDDLAAALDTLEDEETRAAVVCSAREAAREFDCERSRERFWALVASVGSGRRT